MSAFLDAVEHAIDAAPKDHLDLDCEPASRIGQAISARGARCPAGTRQGNSNRMQGAMYDCGTLRELQPLAPPAPWTIMTNTQSHHDP